MTEIEALRDVDLLVLRQRWKDMFCIPPTSRISRKVLIRGVAFRLQEGVYGKLGKSCRKGRATALAQD